MKVTLESASTSETENTEDLEDVIQHPDLAKSLDKTDVAQYQQLEVRSMFSTLDSIKAYSIN